MNRKQFLINEIANLVLSRLNEGPANQEDKFKALGALRDFIPTIESKFEDLHYTGIADFKLHVLRAIHNNISVFKNSDAVVDSVLTSLSEISKSILNLLEPFQSSNELGYGPAQHGGYPASFFRHEKLFKEFITSIFKINDEFRSQLESMLERALFQLVHSPNSGVGINDATTTFNSEFKSLVDSTEEQYTDSINQLWTSIMRY